MGFLKKPWPPLEIIVVVFGYLALVLMGLFTLFFRPQGSVAIMVTLILAAAVFGGGYIIYSLWTLTADGRRLALIGQGVYLISRLVEGLESSFSYRPTTIILMSFAILASLLLLSPRVTRAIREKNAALVAAANKPKKP